MTGKIRKIVENKLFGFILGSDDNDYFFHKEDFTGNFRELEDHYADRSASKIEINFEPTKGDRGFRARNVSLI